MWALRVHERGGPEQLAYEQAPRPYVGIGDALVRVHAASFTPTELTWPSTWVDHAGHDRRPTIPAHEVSGVVEALGYGTIGVAVGQAVYGLTDWYRDGAAAEYVAVEARHLAPKPSSLSHVEAAAVPLAGLTASQALFCSIVAASSPARACSSTARAAVWACSPSSSRAPLAPRSSAPAGPGHGSSSANSARAASSTSNVSG